MTRRPYSPARRRFGPVARPRGFTLIEMVVSVAILSLIMLATVTALRTLASTQVSLANMGDRNDALRSASTFLRDALAATVVGSDSGGLSLGGGNSEATVFEIRPETLLWKTTMLFGESAGGSFIVRVAKESEDIVLRWQKPGPRADLNAWNTAPARTLVKDVGEFAVAFRRGAGDDWQTRWDDRGAPGWVRLRIKAAERYWPDIVVAVSQ